MTDPLFPCPDLASLKKPKKNAVIAVASDPQEAAALRDGGADCTVCAATPTPDDLFSAIGEVYADTAFILPNGDAARFAAIAVASLVQGTRIVILPTASHAEVLTALSAGYDDDADPEDVRKAILEAIQK